MLTPRALAAFVLAALVLAGCGSADTGDQSAKVAQLLFQTDSTIPRTGKGPVRPRPENLAQRVTCKRVGGSIYRCDELLRSGKHRQCRVDYRFNRHGGSATAECAQPR